MWCHEFWNAIENDHRVLLQHKDTMYDPLFTSYVQTIPSVIGYASIINNDASLQLSFPSYLCIDEETFHSIIQHFMTIVLQQPHTCMKQVYNNSSVTPTECFSATYVMDVFDLLDIHEFGAVSERDLFLVLMTISAAISNHTHSFLYVRHYSPIFVDTFYFRSDEFEPVFFEIIKAKARKSIRETELIASVPLFLCRKMGYFFNVDDYVMTKRIHELNWNHKSKLSQQDFRLFFEGILQPPKPVQQQQQQPQQNVTRLDLSAINEHSDEYIVTDEISAKFDNSSSQRTFATTTSVISHIPTLSNQQIAFMDNASEPCYSSRSTNKTPRNIDFNNCDIGDDQSKYTTPNSISVTPVIQLTSPSPPSAVYVATAGLCSPTDKFTPIAWQETPKEQERTIPQVVSVNKISFTGSMSHKKYLYGGSRNSTPTPSAVQLKPKPTPGSIKQCCNVM